MSEAVVLVDARNVLRSLWPNMLEDEVAELAGRWADEQSARAVVVFDGRAPCVSESGRHRVVGTGGETADEWIERASARLSENGERYWLVTSDRALRSAAGPAAERTIGGGTFARELRALTDRR
jgi:predicted RNA-binding protein with PIN domain